MFFESVFCLLENDFFGAVFSVLVNFKALISSVSSVISFSYFLFFISFVCDGFRDVEIPFLQKRLDGLDDGSFSCIFLLLILELVIVKFGLFNGGRAVT